MSKIDGAVSGQTLRKIIDRAARNATEQIASYNRGGAAGDTPIERAIYLALWAEIEFANHTFTCIYVSPSGSKYDAPISPYENPVIVESQIRVLDWPVDFLITITDTFGDKHELVVECDGHDFHERSKEQAKRDRERDRRIQAAGLTIFRFTGSEIWNDPCGCADSILNWAVEKYYHGVLAGETDQ